VLYVLTDVLEQPCGHWIQRTLFGWRLPDHGGYLFNRHWLKDVERCVDIPADDCWVTELSSRRPDPFNFILEVTSKVVW